MGTSAALFGSDVKLLSLQTDPPPVPNEQELLAALISKVGPFADKDKLLYHIRVSAGKVHWAVNSYFRSILAVPAPAREDFDSKPSQSWHSPVAPAVAPADDHVTAAPSTAADTHQLLELSPAGTPCAGSASFSSTEQRVPGHHQLQQQVLLPQGSSGPLAATHDSSIAGLPGTATASPANLSSLPGNALEIVLTLLDLQSLLSAASSCKTLYKAAQSERIWKQLFRQRWGPVMFPTSKHSSDWCACAASKQQAAAKQAKAISSPAGPSNSRSMAAPARVVQQQAGAPAAAGTAQVHQPGAAGGAEVGSSFISRWTGSSMSHSAASYCRGRASAAGPAGAQTAVHAAAALDTQPRTSAGSNLSASCRCLVHNDPEASGMKHSSTCSCSSCAALPAAAPAGTWRQQYKLQHSYAAVRKCPKCGAATVVPIVYGFPSAPLLAGMAQRRLLLGGDHLIDSCHVWACTGCRSCYRYFPYGDVQLWLQDDEQQQRMDQARSAAHRSSRRTAASAAGVGGQEEGGPEGGLSDDADAAAIAGMPRYTYEL